MARFRLTAPDGSKYDVDAPENASDDDVLSYFRQNWEAAKGHQEPPKVGAVEAGLRGALTDASFGLWPKYNAAMNTIRDQIGGSQETFGENYKRRLAIEDARNAAGRQQNTVADIAGRTAGLTASAALTMPARPAIASYEYAREATRPIANALSAWAEGIPDAARYGMGYGAVTAANESRANSVQGLAKDTATGGAAGAVLGPVAHTVLHGIGSGMGGYQRRIEKRRAANADRLQQFRDAGVDNPLPAAIAESGVPGIITRASGAMIGGAPIANRAAQNINQLQRTINRTLAAPIDGQEAGDLGKTIQGDLRRNLRDRSLSSDDIAAMPQADLERMTGPLTEEGFVPPRPRVEPVQPRQVEPVAPRDVGPEPQPPQTANRVRELEDRLAQHDRDIAAATAEHNTMAAGYKQTLQRYQPTLDHHERLTKQADSLIRDINKMYDQGSYMRLRQGSEPPAQYYARAKSMEDQLAQVQREIKKIEPDVGVAMNAINAYGTGADAINRIRQMHVERSAVERNLNQARATKAAEDVGYNQSVDDWRTAHRTAQQDAAAETARRRGQAAMDADEATASAQRAAEQQYEAQIARGDTGFKVGRSRESYPTELSAAYEVASRAVPKHARSNPLGDGYANTNTTKLLDSIAKDAKQRLKIPNYRGDVFDPDMGGLDTQLASYLRNTIGPDLTQRLQQLATMRSGGAAQPGVAGMRGLLSDIRAAARAAEKPPYPALPRTEEASILRRLEGAIRRDLYADVQRYGRPSTYTTAAGETRILEDGRTQSGSREPADATYFLQPQHFDMLTRGEGKPGRTSSVPATLSIKPEHGRVGYFKNQTGEFDRSSLVPYSRNPEPGTVPVQVWGEGARVHYDSPVISRGTTSGERAVSMFQNVDQEYARYVNEMRRPLAKIFGDNVEPVKAMDHLVNAAKRGETSILGPYMKVMTEKSDPVKGAAAVVFHMTNGGRNLRDFTTAWRELPPPTRRILFDTPQGRQFEQELNKLATVGNRLERFVKTAETRSIDPSRVSHIATIAAAFAHWPAILSMTAGNAVTARVLSSPRLINWMTRFPDAAKGGFDTAQFSRHMAQLGAMSANGRDSDRKAAAALKMAMDVAIPAASAHFAGEKAEGVNRADLERAKQMKAAGKSDDEIWDATGFWYDAGRWNWELGGRSPQDERVDDVNRGWEGPSDKAVNDDETFKAYPDLSKQKISLKSSKGGISDRNWVAYTGVASKPTDIFVNASRGDFNKQTLYHEQQHSIDGIESDGKASYDGAQPWDQRRLERRAENATARRMYLTEAERKATPPWVTEAAAMAWGRMNFTESARPREFADRAGASK